jgi:hypothetical protein
VFIVTQSGKTGYNHNYDDKESMHFAEDLESIEDLVDRAIIIDRSIRRLDEQPKKYSRRRGKVG